VEEIEMKWILRIGGGLIGVIALACVVLLVLGHRENAGRTTASTDINASPAQLWQWIDEPGKLKQWVSWVTEVRVPNDSPAAGVGAKRVVVMKDENNGGMPMEIQSIYTKYQPPTEMDLAMSTPGAFEGTEIYKLTDLGNGRTHFEVTGQFHYSMWMAQLFEPLITPAAQKKMDGDVARLKSLVETGTSAAR
jgi:uncharacterized protein YndB with AHSA1/START domain